MVIVETHERALDTAFLSESLYDVTSEKGSVLSCYCCEQATASTSGKKKKIEMHEWSKKIKEDGILF